MRRSIKTVWWGSFAAIAVTFALTAARAVHEQREVTMTDGARSAASGPAGGQAQTHRVVISVNTQTGEFSYSLDPVFAKRGDRIEWTSEQGNWSVRLETTPFAEKSLRGKRGGPKHLVVRPDAAFRSYKYTVGLAVGDDVFTDDPEIIIGPD